MNSIENNIDISDDIYNWYNKEKNTNFEELVKIINMYSDKYPNAYIYLSSKLNNNKKTLKKERKKLIHTLNYIKDYYSDNKDIK